MSRDDSAAERRWQYSLRGMLLLTVVVAAACVSWHFWHELAVLGLPFFMGLTGAMLSRRNRWGFAWMFIVWFWCGFIILLLLLCVDPFVLRINEAV